MTRALRVRGTTHREMGFTLIELLVVISILGVLGAISVGALRAYQRSQEEGGSAHGVVTTLRNAAERAQSEGRTYCVSLNSATTYSIWRYSCQSGWTSNGNTAAQVATGTAVTGSTTTLGSASFAPGVNAGSCSASLGCVYFYPRGTASAGSVVVSRSGSSKTYTVKVEGLTGRVSLA